MRGNVGRTDGWRSILAIKEINGNRYLVVEDWVGGKLPKPPSGQYVGANGYVSDIEDAIPLGGGGSGSQGPQGYQGVQGPQGYQGYQGNQGAVPSNVVISEQEGGVGVLISNIIQVTQAEYDALTPQVGTFYAIVG